MIKVNRRNLFDRIGRYRLSAIILGVVFANLLTVRAIQRGGLPLTPMACLFYVGYSLLLWAVLSDYYNIWKARRAVKNMINDKISGRS